MKPVYLANKFGFIQLIGQENVSSPSMYQYRTTTDVRSATPFESREVARKVIARSTMCRYYVGIYKACGAPEATLAPVYIATKYGFVKEILYGDGISSQERRVIFTRDSREAMVWTSFDEAEAEFIKQYGFTGYYAILQPDFS
jgi:hypothetical protein